MWTYNIHLIAFPDSKCSVAICTLLERPVPQYQNAPKISGGSTGPFLGDGVPVCVCAAPNLMSLRPYAVTYASSPCLHDVKSFSCLISGDRGPLGTCPVCVVLNPMQGKNTWKTTREALSIQPTKVKVAQVSMRDDRNNLCSNPGVHQACCWTYSISDLHAMCKWCHYRQGKPGTERSTTLTRSIQGMKEGSKLTYSSSLCLLQFIDRFSQSLITS